MDQWLTELGSREEELIQQAEAPKVAHARKSGWVWRFAKSHRKWVKRWAIFDSKTNSFSFLASPSQRNDLGSSNWKRGSHTVRGAEPLKHCVTLGDSKLHGLGVTVSNGRCMTLCFQTEGQRSDWLQFLTDCLDAEVTLHERYEVHWQCIIGRGAYADVVLATDRGSGELVAVKMITKAACKKHFELMDKEAQIMSMLDGHPHLLGLQLAFYSEDHIFLITDYLEGRDLMHVMRDPSGSPRGSLPEDRARSIFKQLLLAIDWLHDLGVSHCDLKPENVLLQSRDLNAQVRLADFNSAIFFEDPAEPGGTPEYMAPELVSMGHTQHSSGWDAALDVWSLGILLFWMLCGYTPFHADNVPQVLHNVQSASFVWPEDAVISNEAKDLTANLLQRDPSARPSVKEILQHSWTAREPTLKPLHMIMTDTRAVMPSLAIGSEDLLEAAYPSPCSMIDNVTLAAMNASTPKNLCIRVSCPSNSISYGFAASTAPIAKADEIGLEMELSGLEVSDSLLSLDCPSPSDIVSPGSRDPMDSCMSMHRDLTFRTIESGKGLKVSQSQQRDLNLADGKCPV